MPKTFHHTVKSWICGCIQGWKNAKFPGNMVTNLVKFCLQIFRHFVWKWQKYIHLNKFSLKIAQISLQKHGCIILRFVENQHCSEYYFSIPKYLPIYLTSVWLPISRKYLICESKVLAKLIGFTVFQIPFFTGLKHPCPSDCSLSPDW